jgi:DNA recombination protein RmuC
VLQGLRALEIEEGAKEIRKNVEQLGRHLTVYYEYHQKLGTSLSTTVNHYNAGSREFKKLNKDVLRITGAGEELEVLALERPEKDE